MTQEPLLKFTTTLGTTTVNTTVWRFSNQYQTPEQEAERIRVAKIESQHRAEQLEPVRKRLPERNDFLAYGKDDSRCDYGG